MIPKEVQDRICEEIAEGHSLRSICSASNMPAKSTVFRLLAVDAEFRDRYARAREAQADHLFDEIMEIADDSTEDVNRSRLKVDARKWAAGKLRPKVYGEKAEVALSGEIGVRTIERRIIDPAD